MTTTRTKPATILRHLPALAAEYISEHGWTQGAEQDKDGSVCLTGAIRLCTPAAGDGYIALEVFRRKDHAEAWNDAEGRTRDEVVDYLSAAEITDDDLAETFGPQWPEIIASIRRAAGFTPDDLTKVVAAWDAARAAAGAAAWDAAWDAAGAAAGAAARAAAGAAAGAAARAAARAAVRAAAGAAAGDAAGALAVRDLIGQHGFSQEHYDELTRLWRTTVGPLHPDDADLAGAVTQ